MDLNDDGIQIFPGFINTSLLDELRAQFLDLINKGQHLKSNDDHFAVVNEPYITCPSSLILAVLQPIVDMASDYLGREVALGTCNLRRSKVTSKPPVSTNLFHMDQNCGSGIPLVKAFFYLCDVDENNGPFEYIRGSNNVRMPGWEGKLRWTDEQIYSHYGIDKSFKAVAKYGDLILADTTGFHRGVQVKNKFRDMLTVNYVDRPEVHGKCMISSNHGENKLYKYAERVK